MFFALFEHFQIGVFNQDFISGLKVNENVDNLKER